ncbi:MAG TPA: hypothetical protein VKH44_09940, partial [Pirellulaceae bacterium]|nr:hypothetical protein [Pirellulaceae bacterium]
MNHVYRNSVLEGSGTRPVQPSCCDRPMAGARVTLAIAVAVVMWNCVVVAADAPWSQESSRWIMGGARGSRVQVEPAELDEEAEETVPISRVVPRAKTILPVDPQVRPLPTAYKNGEIRHTNDRGMIESDDEEAFDVEDLRSPARYATPPRAGEWWPDRSTQQRPQSSALVAPVPVAARPA